MVAHRRWVLAGHQSLLTASVTAAVPWLRRVWGILDELRALVEGSARRWGVKLRKTQTQGQRQKPKPIPRPPGVSDDHPLVKSGRYQ